MEMSQDLKEISEAMALAQAEIATASKDKKNPHFGQMYATLASVWDACRAPLTKHGISVVQSPTADGARVTLTTILLHKSGQWFKDVITLQARDATPQSVGSAITYARRYALAAMTSVAPDDDDGNAAQGQARESKPQERRDTPPPPPEPMDLRPDYRPAPPAPQDFGPDRGAPYETPLSGNQCRDFIVDIQSKSGPKKDGSSYTRYSIETRANGFFTTFNAEFANIALDCKNNGEEATITYKTNGRWKDMEAIRTSAAHNSRLVDAEVDSLPF